MRVSPLSRFRPLKAGPLAPLAIGMTLIRSLWRFGWHSKVTKEQIIVAAELTTQENDVNQLHPVTEKVQENIAKLTLKEQELQAVLALGG